jgi:L-ascorbate metabolism protein UlaG (beta-lactamase superfamily)
MAAVRAAIAACAIATSAASFANASSEQTLEACRAHSLDGTVKVTFLGTTTLLFDDGQTQLMIDGFLTRPPASTVVFGEVQTNPTVVDGILDRVFDHGRDMRLAAIFVTHSHYDHALDVAYIAERSGAHLYGSRSTLNIGRGGGLCEAQMTRIRPDLQTPWQVGAFEVRVIKSRHSPPTSFNPTGGVVKAPLQQPARYLAYAEEVTLDFLITHCGRSMLVKASANSVPGALADTRAEVLFLATAQLGRRSSEFMNRFYEQTVTPVHPRLLVPMHWDDFLVPLSGHLPPAPWPIDKTHDAFAFLVARVSDENRTRSPDDALELRVMQGYESLLLFEPGNAPGSPL